MNFPIIHRTHEGVFLRLYENGKLVWEKRLAEREIVHLIRELAASL